MKFNKKIISIIIISISALILTMAYLVKFSPVVKHKTTIYIDHNKNYDNFIEELEPELNHPSLFKFIAQLKHYPELIKSGKYELNPSENLIESINKLRIGQQQAVSLKFNNQQNLKELSLRISEQLDLSSEDLYSEMLNQDFLNKSGFNKQTALAMYLPNTYKVYWNISPKKLVERMHKEYSKFWTSQRIALAKKQELTPLEVSILASIVQKETSYTPERPDVAGLYLNRIHSGMPLQADPTVIYVLKQKYGQDFEVKRVLNKDLSIKSPYNTYLHKGLPPGPIFMPDISSIEAVLNPRQHQYLYMCASTTNIGQHKFAKTLSQHNKNANQYRKWIQSQGIMR